ncbi:MAG: hypothetical protein IMY71_10595 [Bacteroidetes bacterium]|nr:hypothetical protein [Bacteroidota bacterium]
MKAKSITILSLTVCLISLNVFAQKSGEIIFSKKLINPSSPTGLTAQFQSGDNIYSVAFFDKSIQELSGSGTKKNVNMEIFIYELKQPLYDYQQPSEMQLETSALVVSGDALQNNYLPLDIIPGTSDMTAYGSPDLVYKKFGKKFYGPVKFAERISKLEPGEHEIIIKIKCNYNVVSEGKFIIKGDDYTVYQKMSDEINESASNLKTKDTVMPKSARSDKDLESEMLVAFKNSQTYKDRVKGEVLRIVIIDPDWMIRRHQISGVILHRYIRAVIAVKNSDGTCTLWNLVTFQQDYVSNEFQETKFDGIGDPVKIPCDNVNK